MITGKIISLHSRVTIIRELKNKSSRGRFRMSLQRPSSLYVTTGDRERDHLISLCLSCDTLGEKVFNPFSVTTAASAKFILYFCTFFFSSSSTTVQTDSSPLAVYSCSHVQWFVPLATQSSLPELLLRVRV